MARDAIDKLPILPQGTNHMMRRASIESPAIAKLSNRQRTSDACDAYYLAKYAWYRYAPVNCNESVKTLITVVCDYMQDSFNTDG